MGFAAPRPASSLLLAEEGAEPVGRRPRRCGVGHRRLAVRTALLQLLQLLLEVGPQPAAVLPLERSKIVDLAGQLVAFLLEPAEELRSALGGLAFQLL